MTPAPQIEQPAQRRQPRRFMAIKLTPWCKYDLDFSMWLQANFDQLVEEFSHEDVG